MRNTSDIVVCNKSPTMPVHPCGQYHLNSLTYTLCQIRPDLKNYLNVSGSSIRRVDIWTCNSCKDKEIRQNVE